MNKIILNDVILGGTVMIGNKCENMENSIWQNRKRCRLCDSIEIDIFFSYFTCFNIVFVKNWPENWPKNFFGI
jgi:hypothetical protein